MLIDVLTHVAGSSFAFENLTIKNLSLNLIIIIIKVNYVCIIEKLNF